MGKKLKLWFPGVLGILILVALAVLPRDLNPILLEVAAEYPVDGSYGRIPLNDWDSTMGLSEDLYYAGKLKYRGDPEKRTYCSGLMFEVFLKAAKRSAGNDSVILRNVPEGYFHDFRKDFYGVDGDEMTLASALSERGLGKRIQELSAAKPGDFVQFWRHDGSGHAVLFLDCKFLDGLPYELTYWSVQFGGVGIMKETIGHEEGGIDPTRIFIVRAYSV